MIASEPEARDWLGRRPECDALALERLEALVALLREENQRQNLVSAASLDAVWLRHVVDSAQLLTGVPRDPAGCWLDLGSGAGFPGMVIAVLRPEWRVALVESRARRIGWLESLRERLGLTGVEVIGKRLELVESRVVEVISARAFAPLADLLALSARFSTASTLWLLPKGRSAAQELAALTGWSHMFHVERSLTDPEAGIITGHLIGQSIGKGGKKR